MRSRRVSYLTKIIALAAMLFAQAALALASCDLYRAPSHALMVAVQASGDAPCHQSGENANLCLAHCQGGDQTLDKHQVKLPALFVQPVLLIRGWQEFRHPAMLPARAPAPSAAPPPRILFQSLLI